jgi:hypothetical protein
VRRRQVLSAGCRLSYPWLNDEQLQAELDRAIDAWRARELARIDARLRELGAEPEEREAA